MEKKIRTAVFPGSFNPFTNGHKSIVDRALDLFDNIIIAIGFNEHKEDSGDLHSRLETIRNIYKGNDAVSVESYSGLTVDFVKDKKADAILRGVRNMQDFEYERNLADVNREIAGIETVILIAEPQYGYISSSMVRELNNFGYDISRFIP